MNNLSAFIIAKNQENHISRTILSVKDIASEVIVVASSSTDATLEIAKKLGAQTYCNKQLGEYIHNNEALEERPIRTSEYRDIFERYKQIAMAKLPSAIPLHNSADEAEQFVKQKSFAESLCNNNWILNVDADEELSQELQSEIDHIFQSSHNDRYMAYRINYVTVHRNDDSPRYFTPVNKVIRLYDRRFASFSNAVLYNAGASVTFNPDISPQDKKFYHLNNIAYHRPHSSVTQLIINATLHSDEHSPMTTKTGHKISKLRLISELPLSFFKAYFKRRYFVFGLDGFIDALIFAFARFLSLAKARELENNNRRQ